jgi:hypothetical protein
MQNKIAKQSKRSAAATRTKPRGQPRPAPQRGLDVGDVRLQLLLFGSVPHHS